MAVYPCPWIRPDGTVDWRRRNDAGFSFFHHPATCRQTVQGGLFPTDKVASRRTAQLSGRKRGRRLKYVGGVQMNEDGVGRKANVYVYGWNPKHLLHEVMTTDELIRTGLPLWQVPVLRGEMVDEHLRPDASILGRRTVHLEIDLNHEKRSQLAKQIEMYKQLNEAKACVVWFAPNRSRLELIRLLAKSIENVVLFSVLGSGVWEDPAGNRMEAATFCSQVL